MKKKKPSRLQRQKKNPNSTYWKGKADAEWAKQVKTVGRCEICGRVNNLNAHHILNRTRLRYRHDLSNGVCLCSGHHLFDRECCPHGDLYSMDNFKSWFMQNRPGQFQWYEDHKDDKRQPEMSYQEQYEILTS